jgi:hypothetical protein
MGTARNDLIRLRQNLHRPVPPVPPVPPAPEANVTPPAPPAPPSAMAPPVPPVPKVCSGKSGSEKITMTATADGKTKIVTARIACEGRVGQISKAELDRIALVSLKRARVQIVAMPHLTEAQRAEATAKIDAHIASLKTQNR